MDAFSECLEFLKYLIMYEKQAVGSLIFEIFVLVMVWRCLPELKKSFEKKADEAIAEMKESRKSTEEKMSVLTDAVKEQTPVLRRADKFMDNKEAEYRQQRREPR